PEKVQTNVKPPKTMGHGKTMPPETKDKQLILTYFQHMSEKVAMRLRRHNFKSNYFFIGLKTRQGWLTTKAKTQQATDDGKNIFSLCQQFMNDGWQGQGVWQVQVTALHLQTGQQADLFDAQDSLPQRDNLNHAIDDINQKFGEFTIAPSRLLGRSAMPNVIAPSWKPNGHRKTI
ncbi:MAG: DNA polymerase IV, partial [Gammaproteobacteria bacterium]